MTTRRAGRRGGRWGRRGRTEQGGWGRAGQGQGRGRQGGATAAQGKAGQGRATMPTPPNQVGDCCDRGRACTRTIGTSETTPPTISPVSSDCQFGQRFGAAWQFCPAELRPNCVPNCVPNRVPNCDRTATELRCRPLNRQRRCQQLRCQPLSSHKLASDHALPRPFVPNGNESDRLVDREHRPVLFRVGGRD